MRILTFDDDLIKSIYVYATTQSDKKAQIYCCNARTIQICKETTNNVCA
jgi:hypothetical protein